MANQLIQFQNEESSVLIAVPAPVGAVQATGFLDDTIKSLDKSLDQALKVVSAVGDSFHSVFEDSKAETAELEINLQCTAKGTIYVVEGSGNASFKVKLSFKRK